MRARRVLFVDDDDSIRDFVRLALDDAGFEVETAEDGRAALDLLGRWPPDLILLDVRMPYMDAGDFAEAYRQTPGPHAPLVLLTAARDPADSAARIGAEAHLAKPFRVADLVDMVRRFAG
jgi:CheY-like chemotaxis protein